MKHKKKGLLLGVLGLMMTAQWGLSAESSQDSDRELLQFLVKKGIVTQDEAREYDESFRTQRQENASGGLLTKEGRKMDFFGKVQFRAINTTTRWNNHTNPPAYTKFSLRNASIGMRTQLSEDLEAVVSTNIGGDNGTEPGTGMRLGQGLINWKYSDYAALSIGYGGVPFGREEVMPSARAIERSPSNQFFEALKLGGSYTGIRAGGKVTHSGNVYYQTAITNSLNEDLRGSRKPDGTRKSITSNNKPAVWGMVGVKDNYEGLKYDVGTYAASKPNNTKSDTALPFARKRIFGYGFFADMSYERFGLLAEVTSARIHKGQSDSKDANPVGFVIMPSYMITPELELLTYYSYVNADKLDKARIFDSYTADGSDFNPASSGPALDPGSLVKGGSAESQTFNKFNAYYLGLNWYMMDGVKWTFGYRFSQGKEANLTGGGDNQNFHQLGAQVQLTF